MFTLPAERGLDGFSDWKAEMRGKLAARLAAVAAAERRSS
jgi:hypothetical protein